jgi:8-oxo-dGTP pyrophosphatase MutT (NUDIX family)
VDALSSWPVYENPWMTVREDTFRRDDGSTGTYGVVDKPTYALVIAAEGDRVHLVEQFRYPLGARRWEFPQGTAPGREEVEPAELARRELREETGLRAGTLIALGTLDVAPGMSSQRGNVFLATDLTVGPPERELEEQDMRSAWWTRHELDDAVRQGRVSDSQSLAAYALLLLHERQRSQPDG